MKLYALKFRLMIAIESQYTKKSLDILSLSYLHDFHLDESERETLIYTRWVFPSLAAIPSVSPVSWLNSVYCFHNLHYILGRFCDTWPLYTPKYEDALNCLFRLS